MAFAGQPLASALVAATVLVWIAIEVLQGLRRRADAAYNDRSSLLWLRVCIVAGMLLAAYASRLTSASFPRSPLSVSVSLCLMWAGIALRWWSFRTLGRYFTFSVMTAADQRVISTGPYRLLRHPSYAGLLVALCGIGLSFGNWASLAAAVVLPLIALRYRIHVEESALGAALGPAYTTYASSRKRIIPFIW